MLLVLHEVVDKSSPGLGVQVALPLVSVADDVDKLHLLQVDVAAQGSKDMVAYRHFATHLECLDMTDLLDHAVILLNLPMLVMQGLEIRLLEGVIGVGIREENHVMETVNQSV